MALRITSPERSRAAFSLPEMLIAVGLTAILLTGGVSFYIFSITSFASMTNYSELNQKDRTATDIITRDIRNAGSVDSFNGTNLVLNMSTDPNPVTYTYDEEGGTLTRLQSTNSRVLLNNVDSLAWTLYRRPVVGAAYNVFPLTTNIAATKIISVAWTCSRPLAGGRTDSETLQAAVVEMRNQ